MKKKAKQGEAISNENGNRRQYSLSIRDTTTMSCTQFSIQQINLIKIQIEIKCAANIFDVLLSGARNESSVSIINDFIYFLKSHKSSLKLETLEMSIEEEAKQLIISVTASSSYTIHSDYVDDCGFLILLEHQQKIQNNKKKSFISCTEHMKI